jgi:hypothetical protein
MNVTTNAIQHRHLCGQEGKRSRRMFSCFEAGREVYCTVRKVLEDRCSHMTSYRMRGVVYKQRFNYKQKSAWVKRALESKYLIV